METNNIDASFMSDNNSWSKYLDINLPKLFNETIKVDNFTRVIDSSGVDMLKNLRESQTTKLDINKEFTKAFIDIKKAHEINGWSNESTHKIEEWKSFLSFNYLINYHFMYQLKKKESYWSWYLIVISTICSTITVLTISNTLISEIIKYIITFLSVITSLIAAYMKKENFVDRIKEMDRYIQKVGHIDVEIDNMLKSKPWNRISYKEFIDKHYNDIVQLFSAPPPMSPEEFKSTIYNITVYNPELVYDIEPWFESRKIGDMEYYHMTEYGYEVIKSYITHADSNIFINFIRCVFCCICRNVAYQSKFMKFDEYNKEIIFNKLKQKKEFNDIKKQILNADIEFKQFIKETKESNKELDICIDV
jgi:hypothetical protein